MGPSQPKPLTSIGRADSSLLSARPAGVTPGGVTPRSNGTATPYFPQFGALPIWQTLTSVLSHPAQGADCEAWPAEAATAADESNDRETLAA